MSNFPLAYKLSWLPRLLKPSLGGDRQGFLPPEGSLLSPLPERTKRLVFLGDFSAVASREAPDVDGRLKALIASADLVVGNCESPVVERVRNPLRTARGTHHAMTPGFLAAVIDAAAIVPQRLVLSVANNHALDQGPQGYAETRDALAALGVTTVGGGEDGLVRTVDLGGLTIAFVAFTQWRNAGANAFARHVTMLGDLAEDGFATLRRARADLICIVPHWDREFRHFPQLSTRALARTLAESGAGLIVGHHAHVLQPAERIGNALVAYGLGDFLGTALPRIPWPLRLGAVFVVEISAAQPTRGRAASYRIVRFMRQRVGSREKLLLLDAESGPYGERARQRFEAIFPPPVAIG